jgi:hypothetical protein
LLPARMDPNTAFEQSSQPPFRVLRRPIGSVVACLEENCLRQTRRGSGLSEMPDL